MNRIWFDLDGLTIMFVYLKIEGHVQWPWWKVIAPTLLSIMVQVYLKYFTKIPRRDIE